MLSGALTAGAQRSLAPRGEALASLRNAPAARRSSARATPPAALAAPQAAAGPAAPRSAATRTRLGSSDLMVSSCTLGSMTWGHQNTEAEAHEQLDYAFEHGINCIDTAEIYPVPPSAETQGRTDRFIASWLKHRRREDVVLATKVSGYGRQTYLRAGGALPRVDAANVAESVDASLARLGVDHVDLLQIHWPDRYVGGLFGAPAYDVSKERAGDVPFEEQLEALQRVVAAGKVRYVGVSNETSYGVMSFCAAAEAAGLPRITSIQNSYSLLVRGQFETDLAEVCAPRQGNVGLLAYSPLAGGALSGKYNANTPGSAALAKARFSLFQGYMARYQQSLVREAVDEYAKVAAKHGLTLTQLSIGFVHSRWFVASTIIGATTLPQLEENVAAFEVVLSDECLADVDAVYRRFRDPAYNL